MLENFGPVLKILSYVITVVIGGVGFKFLNLWFNREKNIKEQKASANQQAINSLGDQVTAFASMFENQNNRISDLEKDIRKYQEELLRVTSEQIKSEMQVKILQQKVTTLEKQLEYYRNLELEQEKTE